MGVSQLRDPSDVTWNSAAAETTDNERTPGGQHGCNSNSNSVRHSRR
jgi:hypothetical protein